MRIATHVGTKKATIRTVDDFGRLLIPQKIRNQLNWQLGDRLATFVETLNNRLILYKSSAAEMAIDDYGRIRITPQLRNELDWEIFEEIKISVSNDRLVLHSIT